SSVLLSLAVCGQHARPSLEVVASCGDPVPRLRGGGAGLRKALADGDPSAAEVSDRRLGLLAGATRLGGDARLQPLEIEVPASELGLHCGGERRPVLGKIRCERMLGNLVADLREPALECGDAHESRVTDAAANPLPA